MSEICWTNEEIRTIKQDFRTRQLQRGYRVTNEGVIMPIKDMATSHIQNCINKVKKDNRIFGDKTNYCVSVLLNELDSRGEKRDEIN